MQSQQALVFPILRDFHRHDKNGNTVLNYRGGQYTPNQILVLLQVHLNHDDKLSSFQIPLHQSNEVLALSGEPGTLTILNSKGEIIQQKQSLPFTYTSNACVRELKNGKYVVSSGGGDINLIVFDNNLHYYSTLTGKKSN